jgi:hypothetical protein
MTKPRPMMLIEDARVLPIAKRAACPADDHAPPTFPGPLEWRGRSWLLSLEGRWFGCGVHAMERALWLETPAEPIRLGMSGSPVVSLDGASIGVVCLSQLGYPQRWRRRAQIRSSGGNCPDGLSMIFDPGS